MSPKRCNTIQAPTNFAEVYIEDHPLLTTLDVSQPTFYKKQNSGYKNIVRDLEMMKQPVFCGLQARKVCFESILIVR